MDVVQADSVYLKICNILKVRMNSHCMSFVSSLTFLCIIMYIAIMFYTIIYY